MKKLHLAILLVITSAFIVNAQNSCTPLITNGLVAYYPFCGNANDASGNNYNGTVSGASLTTDRFGNANSAYSFTSGSYISVLDAVPLRLNNTDFTISSWVLLNDTLPQSVNYGDYAILSKRDNSGGYIYGITTNDNTIPKPAGYVAYQVAGGGNPRCFSNSKITLQSWQYVVLTYTQSTSTINIYIDGILNSTNTSMPSPNGSTTANLWIGNDVSGSPYYFHGKLDDISIYNRVLTDNEINQLYTVTSSNCLIAYYPFTGNPADSSGNGYNGTVYGATLTTDRHGNPNSAYSFTSGTYISVLDAAPLRLSNTDYSIGAWVLLNDTSPQSVNYGDYAILSKRDNSGGYIFGITTNDNTIPKPAGYVVYQVAGGGNPRCFSNSKITLQNWQYIVLTYTQSTSTIKIYINGTLNSTNASMPSPNGSTTANLWIGNDVSGSPYYFHGKIDDVSIYNCTLTDAEVLDLYNGTSTGIHEDFTEVTLFVYPNPASNQLNIHSLSLQTNKTVTVSIMNVFGQTMQEEKMQWSPDVNISVKNLASGIYFVKVGKWVGKFVKE